MPDPRQLPARLDSVLDALYLMFNEGYAPTSGDHLVRDDVAFEAIRLTRMLAGHPVTSCPRVWALLSLMLLHAARFPARADATGAIFLLRDQDRSRWDRALVAEGLRALDRASAGSEVTAFHLEAGIAACHAAAPAWDATDWPQILELYDALLDLTRSPVVALNRAVAVSRVDGPQAALARARRDSGTGARTISAAAGSVRGSVARDRRSRAGRGIVSGGAAAVPARARNSAG